jgi:hypothetical protein
LRKHTVEQALDHELRSSVEILMEEKIKDGLARSVALRQALIELGGVEQVKEEVRAIQAGRFLENFTRDLRLAFRTLVEASFFTAVVIFTLGLGIGANAPIFAMVSRFVLQPLPSVISNTPHPSHYDHNDAATTSPGTLLTDVRDNANPSPASPVSTSSFPLHLWHRRHCALGPSTSTNFFDVTSSA